MLVFSRQRGESMIVNGPKGGCLLTVLGIRGNGVSLLVSHSLRDTAHSMDAWTIALARDARRSVRIGAIAVVTLVDVRAERVRLGIDAPAPSVVHRLEVWEAIQQERRGRPGGDPEGGNAGAAVPRPPQPKPPTLDVRRDEPPRE